MQKRGRRTYVQAIQNQNKQIRQKLPYGVIYFLHKCSLFYMCVYVHIALYTLYTCSQGHSNYLYYILNYVQIPHNVTNAHKNTFLKT